MVQSADQVAWVVITGGRLPLRPGADRGCHASPGLPDNVSTHGCSHLDTGDDGDYDAGDDHEERSDARAGEVRTTDLCADYQAVSGHSN